MYDGFSDFVVNTIDFSNPYDLKLVKNFLSKFHIDYFSHEAERTIILETSSGDLVGTGSSQKNIIKFIAVDDKYQGSNAFSMITSVLSEELLTIYDHIFIYTHPKNKILFTGLGFKLIAEAQPYYALFEFGLYTIEKYKKEINAKAPKNKTEAVAIVANCNPFTCGHQYLIEQASKDNELVYLFVVEAEKSVFPFNIRWKLIEEGISHLDNVIMIRSKDYLVSEASFPSYFLKGKHLGEITANQARLDIIIFATHIAPTLNIKKRYVGTENYCETTAIYNNEMKRLLPEYGIEFVEIERKKIGENDYISASSIRKAIAENNWDVIKKKVPSTTYEYLRSEDAKAIIRRVQINNSRH